METTLYEVVESTGAAEVCVTKNAEVSVPLSVILQPSETTSTDPDFFTARGNACCPQNLGISIKILVKRNEAAFICVSQILI